MDQGWACDSSWANEGPPLPWTDVRPPQWEEPLETWLPRIHWATAVRFCGFRVSPGCRRGLGFMRNFGQEARCPRSSPSWAVAPGASLPTERWPQPLRPQRPAGGCCLLEPESGRLVGQAGGRYPGRGLWGCQGHQAGPWV